MYALFCVLYSFLFFFHLFYVIAKTKLMDLFPPILNDAHSVVWEGKLVVDLLLLLIVVYASTTLSLTSSQI